MEQHFNQLQCTLCGRSVSIRKFDPTDFVNDVIGIRFVGLGYGRGFGVAAKGSILHSGDPVLELMAGRVLEISRFLLDAEIITKSMLESRFPFLASNTESRARLSSEVEALEVEIEDLENKITWFKNEVAKLESEIETLEINIEELEGRDQDEDETEENGGVLTEITDMVEEVIGDEFYERNDEATNAGENLKQMIVYLLNEYEALVE